LWNKCFIDNEEKSNQPWKKWFIDNTGKLAVALPTKLK
jgi:hypothetical protein